MTYQVKIERLYHDTFKYRFYVTGDNQKDYGYADSKWGARRKAKQMIAKWESKPRIVKEYEVETI